MNHFEVPQKNAKFSVLKTCQLAVAVQLLTVPQRGQKIKPFTCKSFSENYFSLEIEWDSL